MVVKVLNKWIFDGKKFEINDLVEMSEEFFNHLSETSVVAIPEHSGASKVFTALITGRGIAEDLKAKIELKDVGEKFSFKLTKDIDGGPKDFFYTVHKDPEYQTLGGFRI